VLRWHDNIHWVMCYNLCMQKLIIIATLVLSLSLQAANLSADLVVTNGIVRTMDKKRSVAQSIAVLNGKIVAVGRNSDTKAMIGPKTKVIDAKHRLVLPGFNDAHVHFMHLGLELHNLQLRDAKTTEEFVARIRDYVAKVPKGRWIQGGGWNHENWTPSELPTAKMIDEATRDNPVLLTRLDGHMALANTAAMKLAGVSKSTPDVEGGIILRDKDGNPTGIFKDAALNRYFDKVIPEMSFEHKLEIIQGASEHAASLGVTSVQDMSGNADVAVYQELIRRGTLKTRIYGCSPLSFYKRWENTGVQYAFGNSMLRIGCLKGFADGSLGSTTAWLFEPYLDAPKSTGLAGEEFPNFADEIAAAEKNSQQVMIHAIGDRANAEILSLYEKNNAKAGARDRRFRIEHAQHLRDQEIPKFAKDGVVASMQPIHLADDGHWAFKRLDEKRLQGTYAFRSLLDSGARLAFGSDAPVAPLNPLLGIAAAVTRRTDDGKNPNGWIAKQKISVDEAAYGFTAGSAYAEFQENVKGTLEVGKLADFIIVSDDLFTIDVNKIRDATVLLTVMDGRVVYQR